MVAPNGSFAQLVEAVDRLSVEEQRELVDIVRHRLLQRERARVAAEIAQSRKEFDAGDVRRMSADEFMNEARS